MNVADSAMLADILASRGYTEAAGPESADLIVVNTCAVRRHAELRALARIREFAALKQRAHPVQQIWVVGCMAESMGASLKTQVPAIDRVIGATKIEHISHDIDGFLIEAGAPVADQGSAAVSTFLPVMRGCDNFCSYCIVPYVRGREHSLPAKTVVEQARTLVKRGAREITLLGQNVNSYRDETCDFAGLIRRLHEIEGLRRIRFTTSHPKDLSDALIRVLGELPKVCNHIHLPVQSGSNRVLSAMNRRYSREEYLRKVDAVRAASPDIDITTDVMAGFPGESEQDFEDTLALFEQVRYTAAFMFAYSARAGTAAARASNQVPDLIKKERLSRIIKTQTEITRAHYDSMVGKTVAVLITGRQEKKDRAWIGQDYGCKRTLIHCEDRLTGTILDVRISKSTGMTLVGERAK